MKNIISTRQIITMMFLMAAGSVLSFGGNGPAGRDSWISVIISTIITIILFIMFADVFSYNSSLTYFEVNTQLFGKFISYILNIYLIFIAFMSIISSASIYSFFVKSVSLTNTARHIILFFMFIIVIIASTYGFDTLGKWSQIVFGLVFGLIVLSLFLSLPKISFDNILPIMDNNPMKIAEGVLPILSMPFLEGFFLICLFFSRSDGKGIKKVIVLSIIIIGVCITLIFLRNIMLLGYPAIKRYLFPSYVAIGLVSLGDFFQRFEVITAAVFLLGDIFKMTVLAIFCSEGIKRYIETRYIKHMTFIVISLAFIISYIAFENVLDLFRFLMVYGNIISISVILVIFITFITYRIRKNLSKPA